MRDSEARETTGARETATRFVHHAALYGSDRAFLEMAVPFLTGGLAAGEPVLAATTSANLELLRDALGREADSVDYAESAYFGRRPPHRVAAFERYRKRHPATTRIRIIAEPVWTGRSASEVTDWERMESGLNMLLSGTGISMICPYDTRVVPVEIAADAQRTHPTRISGEHITTCRDFVEPADFTATHRNAWPKPPADAAQLSDARDSRDIRRFVTAKASAYELAEESAALLVMAISEVAAYLRSPVTVRVWAQPNAIVGDLQAPAATGIGPFPGFTTPRLGQPAAEDGVWYARQVCDLLEIRAQRSGVQARLHFPTHRAAELDLLDRSYLA